MACLISLPYPSQVREQSFSYMGVSHYDVAVPILSLMDLCMAVLRPVLTKYRSYRSSELYGPTLWNWIEEEGRTDACHCCLSPFLDSIEPSPTHHHPVLSSLCPVATSFHLPLFCPPTTTATPAILPRLGDGSWHCQEDPAFPPASSAAC